MTPPTRPARAKDTAAEPSHPALFATLAFALCTLLLAWPALGGGFLVNPRSDQYIGGWPVRDFAGQALKAGQGIPQWNPYIFGGLPYIAAMHGDIFYPTALLRLILPTDIGMTWGFVIHIFLAGCFTYGFLRAWGLGFYPSLIGGIAYMMSGNLAGLVSPGHDGKLFVSTLMPLTLWFLVRGIRDGRHWAWGAIAIAVGLAVLSPHPQLLQYMLLTCGAFGLFLTLSPRPDGSRLTRREGVTRLALGAVLVGFAIGAVQYLPVMEYIPFSPRAGGQKGWEHAISYSMPIEELLNTYLPQFSGILDNYWGRNGIHLHSEYLGAAVLMLASAAFGGEQRKSFRRFWLVTLGVAVLWALGGFTPFYHLIYAIVPGTKYFRAPSTMLMVVSMATAILAALGTERILEGARTRRFYLGWIIAAVVVALLASVGFFTMLGRSIAAGFAGDQFDERIGVNQADVILGAWRSLLFVGLTAGLAISAQQRRITWTVFGWGLAAVVAIDLWSVERLYWLFSPRASVVYASDPAIEYLKTAEPGRVLAAPLTAEGLAFRDPFYGGDAFMPHRVRVLQGYHGNELGRYQRIASRENVGDYGNLVNPAFWRLANARYLYTNAALGDTAMKKLVGPVKNAVGSTVYLYRLPGNNPPAWVVPAMAKAGDEATLGTVLNPRFDPLRVAVIDSLAPISVPPITGLPEPLAITANITRYDAGHIAVQLSGPAPAGSALVVSENYYPGWTATIPGQAPIAAVRTNYTFLGVPLPAGATQVVLTFQDPAYAKGRLVTYLAVLIALLATAAGAFSERRRRVV
ncbi:MAG TPA: hypothetical protein VF461_05495 [Gemmatimonadaceae bacterium]